MSASSSSGPPGRAGSSSVCSRTGAAAISIVLTSLRLAFAETVAPSEYASEVGQDKWVLERVFPGTERGFFVEVGSGHGYIGSNSLALERRGWTGICVDPFPTQMEGRTCETFEEVVYSETGRLLAFHLAGGLGGVAETLGAWNQVASRAPVVHKRAITLRDLLARTTAPSFIHFVSIDIEGAELEALRGFPFERHRVGAWTIEHNNEEPKRSEIRALLQRHGYRATAFLAAGRLLRRRRPAVLTGRLLRARSSLPARRPRRTAPGWRPAGGW